MKVVQLQEYGGPDKLVYLDVPTPRPADDEVLVKLSATSINPVDFKLRSGAMKAIFPLQLPAVLGRDLAGEVAEIGKSVKDFHKGDRVMALANHTYAEYVVVKASDLTKIPDGLDNLQAGAIPLVVLTGTQLIEKVIEPKAGQVVLVTGAMGGVGRTAVLIATEHGAKVIAGIRAKQKDEAAELKAYKVVALDSDAEIAGLEELDAIADTVGGETLGRLIPKVKKSGVVGSVLGKPAEAEKAGLTAKAMMSQPDAARLQELAQEVAKGSLKIPVTKVLKLREAAEAQELAEKGAGGKIVLVP